VSEEKSAREGASVTAATEVATLGGGCFWCVEAVFDEVRGVEHVESGYEGGRTVNPTYEQVCSGTTGHAEVVKVTFSPAAISYKEILEIFFTAHDPTTLNRQGADIGTQYRSVIFYHDEGQREIAEQVVRELDEAKIWDAPIVTEIAPAETFYEAEDYHQEYFARNSGQGYCRAVVAPKVAKFRQRFRDRLKSSQ
jgi:peptide-methionine (S)-S-oxide reductase